MARGIRSTRSETTWIGLSKGHWIAAARAEVPRFRRRNTDVPGYNYAEPCAVCGLTSELTEFHHLIPLEEQFDRGFVRPSQEHAWLCPNHHAMIHKFIIYSDIRKIGGYKQREYLLTAAQLDKICALAEVSRKPHFRDGERQRVRR